MRPRPLSALAFAALLHTATSGAFAGGRRAEHRAEALKLIGSIASGGNLESDLARVKYLGEGEFVAGELAREFPPLVEARERQNISFALGVLGARSSEPVLLTMVKDADPVIRMNAAQGLGRIPTRDWRALLPLLKDGSEGVRAEAAKALGGIKAQSAGKPLLAAAKKEAEPEVRSAMLTAAGDSGDRSVASGLAGYLSSSSESTRLGAARGLCHMGAPDGLAFAKKLLDSKDRFERRSGLDLFEGSSARVAGKVLHPLLKDPDVGLAARAARILYQGGEPVMLDWLVLASYHATVEQKDAYERELELLHLQDNQRKAILVKAGAIGTATP